MLIRVLLAMESEAERSRLERLLGGSETVVTHLGRRADLWRRLNQGEIDVVLLGQALLHDEPHVMIESIRKLPESPEVVVITRRENAGDRASLLAAGCLAVVNQTVEDDVLREILLNVIDRRREDAITKLKADRPEEQYSLDDFISESPAMQAFTETARRVAQSDSSLLVLGETGVGKERLARAIHAEGPRASGPFMAVNCGAIPEGLLESELFGHEEGAFTGATRSRRGYFELAHAGTLFLDEIGDVPAHLQVKLLRALEDRKIHRVGGEKPIQIDVRIIAATNRDLESEVTRRKYRADLYYRLAVVTLTIPPLRDRREDIPVLAESYLDHFRVQTARNVTGISPDAMEALIAHDWPGNVRELINALERAVLLGTSDQIMSNDLPERVRGSGWTRDQSGASPVGIAATGNLPEEWLAKTLPDARQETVDAFERAYLTGILTETRGRIGESAARAGINERSLYALMKRHGLRKEDFRTRSSAKRRP
jgi:DNA-binding NtrC family response regulator